MRLSLRRTWRKAVKRVSDIVKCSGQFSPIKRWDFPQGGATKPSRPYKLSKRAKKHLKKLNRNWRNIPRLEVPEIKWDKLEEAVQ